MFNKEILKEQIETTLNEGSMSVAEIFILVADIAKERGDY